MSRYPLLANLFSRLAIFAAISVTSLIAPETAPAQAFTFTQISTPDAGTAVTGVNDSNVVVGSYLDSTLNTLHGFMYQNGTLTRIDGPLSNANTVALAINNSGQILIGQGQGQATNNFPTAYFIYSGGVSGTYTPIGLKGVITATGADFSFASLSGLNDNGEVVGLTNGGNGAYGMPALGNPGTTTPPASRGKYTQFNCPADTGYISTTGAINNQDQVTGSCSGGNVQGVGSVNSGFVFNGSSASTFYYPAVDSPYNPPSYNTGGIGISNSGIVAGFYQSVAVPTNVDSSFCNYPFQGLIYNGSNFTLVVPPGACWSEATGVNNNGVVVGIYVADDCAGVCGFITLPTAEPPPPSISRLGELLGDCNCSGLSTPGQPTGGDPITISTGNLFEQATDYKTVEQNPLDFIRYYNSQGNGAPVATLASSLGVNWRSTYDRYLNLASAGTVTAERADGQQLTFTLNGGTWTPETDVDVTLTNAGAIWTLTDHNDTVETYTAISATEAQLQSIKARSGYTQTLFYNGINQLISVSDSYGRTLTLAYANGLLHTLTTPDGTTVTYGYTATGGSNFLASATYSTTPAATITYLYQNGGLPFALTGITDEDGNRYATWTYDPSGRVLTSQLGAGANLTTVAYNADGSRTVTNALGVTDTYKFTTRQGVPKVTEIDRAATATTAVATELFTYDANGYTASQTDWNGNQTTYVNNVHGQPTTINEAVGTAVARTTTIAYDDPTFVHLPEQIVTPGLTATFTYDGSGELLTRTLTDTTATTVPYSTNGQTRTWTNTWSNFLLASTKTPNGNTTTFAYDGSGALVKITNALNQATDITAHTGGGLPLTVVDPNGVTTTLTYDARQRPLTGTVETAAGPRTTTYTYDPAGNLIKTTLPDGSALANTYDTAHRLTTITDLFHQNVAYTLDALGDRTRTNLTAVGNRIQRQHSDDFDALGRVLQDIGGVGQTTAYAYDPDGNALTITDPLGRVTSRVFDALNRLSKVTDPNSGVTTTTYDPHDRVLSVTDPNGNTTAYVYDGFGDLIQQTSPDSGITVYRFDADGNVTQKLDAAGNVTNNTYDAVDRVLTTRYPANATLNVAYTYDQAGHGFGIGRLTSLTDAAGSLSRSYDQLGNLLSNTRVNGTTTLKTVYTYDAASRVATITYPSGWTVSQTRDIMGRIWQLPVTTPASVSAGNAITNATYEPFGPLYTLSYGNGVNESRSFDLDYRVTSLTDTGATELQNLSYVYDANDNVSSIADGVTPANSQAFGYDVLNRLTSAAGAYGVFGWTYDKVGNRLKQILGGATTAYGYTAGTNRLASITAGGGTTPVSYTATGNISSIPPTTFAPVATLTYSAANRLVSEIGTPVAIISMVYDAFGQRFSKADPGSKPIFYTYDQNANLLEENDNGFPIDYVYLNSRPVAEITGGKLYYMHADRLGTPQLATDPSQNVAWTTTYRPFGTTGVVAASIVQDLRFPGQNMDVETGFSYNLFRDYMPNIGRYLESDPIGLPGGSNPYLYVGANPVTNIDPTGLSPKVGPPGTIQQFGTTFRIFDMNGDAAVDVDCHADHGAGMVHYHIWNNGVRGEAIPID
jgi:RHS repeat-associated protein